MAFTDDSYRREIDYIFNRFPSFQKVGTNAYKPGIESVKELCRRLGNPQERFRSIHVAGTNGKGSTSHIMAAVLSACGQRTGLFTSPHLVDFRERIKTSTSAGAACSGGDSAKSALAAYACDKSQSFSSPYAFEMVPREFVYGFIVENKALFEELNVSFFEITAAMAFAWFAMVGVDVAVIECGLGGRLDSTNIITPELSIITNIGLDHCNLLGDTKEKIAFEKAGIIKPGVPVVIGEDSGVGEIFRGKAAQTGSRIVFADSMEFNSTYALEYAVQDSGGNDGKTGNSVLKGFSECDFESLLASMDLGGVCQRKNLKTVLCALHALKGSGLLPEDTEISLTSASGKAIANAAVITGLHGRWEILSRSPFIVCDTGHNAHGFALLGRQIADSFAKWRKKCEQNSVGDACQASGESSGSLGIHPRLFMIFGVMADKDLDSIVEFLPKDEAHYLFVAPATPRAMAADKLQKKMVSAGFDGEVVADGSVNGTLKWYKAQGRSSDFVFIGGSTFVVADALVALDLWSV